VAKASGKVAGDQYWDMLRLLLEQRFELKHHTQEKSTQLYALMPVREGTSLGPKLIRSPDPDCPVNPTGSNFCGVSAQPGRMIGQRVAMVRIARIIGIYRPSRTGSNRTFGQLRFPTYMDAG
jgi:uncharacterized protein (TIGR03435 family)